MCSISIIYNLMHFFKYILFLNGSYCGMYMCAYLCSWTDKNKKKYSDWFSVQVPEGAFQYNVTVAASDTDVNKHTNQGSYVRFCCDAAQAAVLAQQLTGFKVDIARYPLKVSRVKPPGLKSFGSC